MAEERRIPIGSRLILGLCLAALFAQGYPSLSLKTPTFDEPAHIGAGLSYLKTGQFRLNLQHPPLLKEIGALPLVLLGVRWPFGDEEWARLTGDQDPFVQWEVGQRVIFQNDPDRVMFWSRLPFLLLALLLGGLVYAWGRRIAGEAAALGAVGLYALDPNIVAHATLVTTDAGFALFAFLFLFALWRWLNHRTLRRLLQCGAALGAALAAKFAAVALLPIAFLLVFWATRWIPAAMPPLPSTIVDPYASSEGGQRIVWGLYSLAAIAGAAAALVYALYFFPTDPFLYLRGLGQVNADHNPTHLAYLAGEFRPHFYSYYAVATLLKEPLPILLLAAVGLFALLRRGEFPVMERAFLLLPPALIVLAYTLRSHNLGMRYMIPALPFLHLLGGIGLARLLRTGRLPARGAAGAALLWLGIGAAGIFPDHLSYFNEAACLLREPSRLSAAGGSSCGPYWLDDSNVDWGQGLKQLKGWLDENAPGRRVRLAYFGSIRPEYYVVDHERVTGEALDRPPGPGLHAYSAHLVARALGRLSLRYGSGAENWILHTPPTAVVGQAYYVYDLQAVGGP
jgi:hypothetical protein